jgi:hypothetical protein
MLYCVVAIKALRSLASPDMSTAKSVSPIQRDETFVELVNVIGDWVARHRDGSLGPFKFALHTIRDRAPRSTTGKKVQSAAGGDKEPRRRRTLSTLMVGSGSQSQLLTDSPARIPEICPHCRLSTRRWKFCGATGTDHRPTRTASAAGSTPLVDALLSASPSIRDAASTTTMVDVVDAPLAEAGEHRPAAENHTEANESARPPSQPLGDSPSRATS